MFVSGFCYSHWMLSFMGGLLYGIEVNCQILTWLQSPGNFDLKGFSFRDFGVLLMPGILWGTGVRHLGRNTWGSESLVTCPFTQHSHPDQADDPLVLKPALCLPKLQPFLNGATQLPCLPLPIRCLSFWLLKLLWWDMWLACSWLMSDEGCPGYLVQVRAAFLQK